MNHEAEEKEVSNRKNEIEVAQQQLRKERARRYYERHKKRILAKQKAKRDADNTAYRKQLKAYRDSKPELVRKWRDTYNAKRRAN